MATQSEIFTEAKNGLDSANHTVSGLIEYLRHIFGKLENASGGGGDDVVDVSDKITAHTGITLNSNFSIIAKKIGNMVFLMCDGGIDDGSATAGTFFTLLDIDESLEPSHGVYAYCYGTESSNRQVNAKSDNTIRTNCGAWCSFEVFWTIANK